MSPTLPKIAGAPISWGVCEVPGWGFQLDSDRVLSEMSDLGLTAAEFGPEGFLPQSPAEKARTLQRYGLTAVGGFVPAVLHVPDRDPVPGIERELEGYLAAGADVLILAGVSEVEGYDAAKPTLDQSGWQLLCHNLDRIRERAAGQGVRVVLHPHVGTMVETEADIERVLEATTMPFCIDTGHFLIGGTDPVLFAASHPDRVAHTHLKDVDLSWARKVRSAELTYYEAVTKGLYLPLGHGELDVRALVVSLMETGYNGWFTLEQDNVVTAEPERGEGPIVDARASVGFLRAVLAELGSPADPGRLRSP